MKLKIMSFNIQHGRNNNLPGDVIDLPLMVKTVKDCAPDIVGFQEVRQGTDPEKAFWCPDEPKFFKDELGGDCHFGAAFYLEPSCYYGNALWSKHPYEKIETIKIPDVPKEEHVEGFYYESRTIIRADYVFNGKPLTVLTSHFGLGPQERDNAVDLIYSIAESTDNPIILMGDFNMIPDNYNIERLSKIFTDVHVHLGKDELTFSSNNPHLRIDYIFSRGLKILSAEVVKVIASDHFPITAEFEL